MVRVQLVRLYMSFMQHSPRGLRELVVLVAVVDEVLFGEGEFFWWTLAAFGVFAEDVDFDVEQAAGGERAKAGGLVGVGDDGDFYFVGDNGSDGEADAFDGDRALGDDVAGEGVGETDAETPVGLGRVGCDGVECDEGGGAVDMALNDVAAEGRADGCGELQVEDGVGTQVGERGAGESFGCKVGGEARREGVGFDAECGEADAVDCDAVAGVEARGECGRGDGDACCAFSGSDGKEGASGFDESREHKYRV